MKIFICPGERIFDIIVHLCLYVIFLCLVICLCVMLHRDMDEEVEDLTMEIEQNENVVDRIEEPKVGMIFDSIDDVVEFYRKYAKEKGFGMSIRTSKKVGGEVRYVTVACSRESQEQEV